MLWTADKPFHNLLDCWSVVGDSTSGLLGSPFLRLLVFQSESDQRSNHDVIQISPTILLLSGIRRIVEDEPLESTVGPNEWNSLRW
jgi:hypothetical protein